MLFFLLHRGFQHPASVEVFKEEVLTGRLGLLQEALGVESVSCLARIGVLDERQVFLGSSRNKAFSVVLFDICGRNVFATKA